MKDFEIQTVAIIPTFNEETTVGNVVRSALRADSIDAVVLVDDGSDDFSSQNAQSAAQLETSAKSFDIVTHKFNQGKTESLISGIDFARKLGSASLSTLVFLDADSSPIWSRDTQDNMKLWQVLVNKLARAPAESLSPETFRGREDAFITLLARYIDEIAEPVVAGDTTMRIGMYQRNVVTDTLLTLLNFGGHAGNRAIPIAHWDKMLAELDDREISVSGWEIEAALNSSVPAKNVGSFLMHGVVNVGSRKKTGSVLGGVLRMATIHGQAIKGAKKFRKTVKNE